MTNGSHDMFSGKDHCESEIWSEVVPGAWPSARAAAVPLSILENLDPAAVNAAPSPGFETRTIDRIR